MLVLALVAGCALAAAAWYSWRTDLNVSHLNSRICTVQPRETP